VYRSRSAAQIGDLPNLRRVEVLRGPQSTLFGKNASAGIISVVTAEPQFDFEAGGEISYGNYGAFVAKLDATGPLSETVAFSLAGNYNRRDGYVQDLALGRDVNTRNRYGIRGQLLFEPSDALKIRLIGDYDSIDEICCAVANVVNGPTGAIVNALAGGTGLVANSPFSYTVRNNFPSSNDIDNYGFSGQIDYEFGALSLTSITAYREVRADTNQDSDFTSANLLGMNAQQLAINTFTQELRLASDFDGPVNFLLGGYYFDEGIDQQNQLLYGTQFRAYGNALIGAASGGALSVALLENTFGALEGNPAKYTNQFFATGQGFNENYTLSDTAYSIFGTVDFDVTDRLTVSAGFNYTHDSKDFRTNNISTDVFSGINLDAAAYAPFRQTLLYQGGLAQQVGAALMLGRSATAAEITAFATNPLTNPTFNAINTAVTAFAAANANNPAANPLGGLRALQFLPPFLNLPNAVEPGRTRDSDWSYSLRASYEVSDAISVYATYATGFKASSINLSRDSRPTATDRTALIAGGLGVTNLSTGTRFAGPEDSNVIEFGIKGQFDAIAFNIALFDQTVKGFQSNRFNGAGFSLVNAGSESVKGVEFDTSINPIEPLTLTAAVTYLDAVYDSFVQTGFFINGVEQDLTGQRPVGVPEWSLSLGAAYVHEFSSGTTLTGRLDYS
ncbi:MAG: TonB-dependent receptor, partial [Sphingopyxis sp.]